MQLHIKKPKKNYLKKPSDKVRRHKAIETKTNEEITNTIGLLHLNGFDRIHLPGGTAIDGSFYAGAIVVDYNPMNKEVYFLGVPYNSNFHLKNESTHNKRIGESPESAVIRETLEETGIHILSENLNLVLEKSVPDNRPNKSGKFHTKYFYLVTKFTGTLFDFDGEPNTIDAETTTPLWIPASMIRNLIFGGHKPAIEKAMEQLSMENREYAIALMNIL